MLGVSKEEILETNKRLEDKRRALKDGVDEGRLAAGAGELGMDWFADDAGSEKTTADETLDATRRVDAGAIAVEVRDGLYCIFSERLPEPFCLTREELLCLDKAIQRILRRQPGE
jgi:hypothetical protein